MAAKYPYDLVTALKLLGWVGPPRLYYQGHCIDGRQRIAACEQAGIRLAEQTIHRAASKRDAARRLIAAGHYSRCEQFHLLPFPQSDTRANLDWAGTGKPARMAPKYRYEPKLRANAIEALVRECKAADNRGDDFLSLSAVKRIIERWTA